MSTRTIIVCLDGVSRGTLARADAPRLSDVIDKGQSLTFWSQPTASQAQTCVLTGRFGFRTLIGGPTTGKGSLDEELFDLPFGLTSIHGEWSVDCCWPMVGFHLTDHVSDILGIVTSAVEAMKDGYEQIFINCPPCDPGDLDKHAGSLIDAAMQLGYRMLVYASGNASGKLHEKGLLDICSAYGWGELPPNILLSATDILTLVDGRLRKDSCAIGRRQYLYSEKFGPNGEQPDRDNWSWAIRDSRWKLIRTAPAHNTGLEKYELFDLELDANELTNLLDEQPAELARLKAEALRIQSS